MAMKYIGVFTYSELIEKDLSRKEIDRMVRTGDLIKLRRDWYATKLADPSVCAIVRKGWVVSCLKALRLHGVWVLDSRTKAHARGNSAAYRTPNTLCRQYGRPEPLRGAVDDLPTAYRHAAKCVDGEDFIAISDSILNQRLMTIDEMRSELVAAPMSKQLLLDKCDGNAQSGTESMVRVRLRAKRLKVRTQVMIEGLGHVDLLIGKAMIIEVDGETFHRTDPQYAEDRRRDRKALELGYFPLRYTYKDVVLNWAECEKQILNLVRQKRHRRLIPTRISTTDTWEAC